MKYRFILTYTPTDGGIVPIRNTRTCFPLHNNELAINIERASDEWYYTRNLDGNLVFTRDDYDWIMAREFDGTFTLNIKESHDNGSTFYDYFTGTFSRASMEIDEDNRTATLNGLKEGVENLINNGKNEDYDLMKLIPDSESKEVHGLVLPALAMVDYRAEYINQSDMYCNAPFVGSGYKGSSGWNGNMVTSTPWWNFLNIFAEAKLEMDEQHTEYNGTYIGSMHYGPSPNFYLIGDLLCDNGCYIRIKQNDGTLNYRDIVLYDANDNIITTVYNQFLGNISPIAFTLDLSTFPQFPINKLNIVFHYIKATLLTAQNYVGENSLDTGDYYKGMEAFNNSDGGLVIEITTRTDEQPNGHRMVPGSDDFDSIPQYFAPPDESGVWIPLAEDNWNYASMWYHVTPSVTNGLADPDKVGSFAWTRCWTIGTCIKYLLKKITSEKVIFDESTNYSQFLYNTVNPVEEGEQFSWLVTQKSNVMHPSKSESAARCIVRLDWFLELLRNAFNCYYWFEKRNDGKYDFKIEHVEYFRRGGEYSGDLTDQLDLTRLKPYRNFLRNGQTAKRYADQTNKYSFDLDGMAEKYTFSWQGDGGSDEFKGFPMFFKAGWIEKGKSEDHQVDNIFADLGWLMLNAGTDTASSKNYDGLFLFSGYLKSNTTGWNENSAPATQTLTLITAGIAPRLVAATIWLTAPSGQQIVVHNGALEYTYTGTGEMMLIEINTWVAPLGSLTMDFGANYSAVTIYRVHGTAGNVYLIPNTESKLHPGVYLQNGPLSWPWLQNEYLHYDIPAAKWSFNSDDIEEADFLSNGTIKMVKKQTIAVVPVPDASTEDAIVDIMGVKTGLGTGIIDSAKINLSSRNAEMTIIYDINPNS